MVPSGWLNTSIDDNITFSGGAQPPREVFKFEPEEGYIRLIQIRDYKTDKFATYVPQKLARKFCTVDDVMIGRYGPPIFQILRGIEGAYNVALIKAIPKDGVDKDFMYYFLKRDPLLRVIESYSQRTSGQTGIEMDVLKAYPMHLPPLPEQRKIAKILSTWDKAISTTERLIDNSKQQKKALMQQLLTGAHTQRKRLLDDSGKPFEGEWEEVKLGDLSTKITKGTTPSTNGFSFQQHGINFVKVESISSTGAFNKTKFAYIDNDCHESFKRSQLEKDDILFSIAGALGRTALVEDSILPANTNQALAIVRLDGRLSEHRYINYYLNSPRITSLIKGLTAKAAQPNLSLKDVNSLTILLPSLKEQEKIAAVLTNADKEIELLEQQLADLKQEKKALMQQLLTGKRRVKVDDKEVA